MVKHVNIYSDGACSVNPGKGGWAAILLYGEIEKTLSGGEIQTTNNRMELKAAIEGLKALKEVCEVKLYSDSAYLVNAINEGWLENWKKHGYKRKDSSEKQILNPDLWEELSSLISKHNVTFIKVKGHAETN